MVLSVLFLALAAPNPASLNSPRQAYVSCLRSFEAAKRTTQMTVDAYAAEAKSACAGERDSYRSAMVAYDTAMGAKKAEAASNADLDIEDYVMGSVERYRDVAGPAPQ